MSAEPTVVEVDCLASPEQVFDVLTDLETHLDWGGRRNLPGFKLLTMQAPEKALEVGSEFSSSGSIVGSLRRFSDRSRVTEIDRPSLFAFETRSEAQAAWARPKKMRFFHRYDLTPTRDGCHITYSITLLEATRPLARMQVPGVKAMTLRVAVPFLVRRGLANLARTAESTAVTSGDSGTSAGVGEG